MTTILMLNLLANVSKALWKCYIIIEKMLITKCYLSVYKDNFKLAWFIGWLAPEGYVKLL